MWEKTYNFVGQYLVGEGLLFFYSFKAYYKTPKYVGEIPSHTLRSLNYAMMPTLGKSKHIFFLDCYKGFSPNLEGSNMP